jgi:hypothetical protein
MKPRKNYRSRPKKSGAKRNYRIKTQKKRLAEAGVDQEKLKHMTVVDIRGLLIKTGTSKKSKSTAKKTEGSKNRSSGIKKKSSGISASKKN